MVAFTATKDRDRLVAVSSFPVVIQSTLFRVSIAGVDQIEPPVG